MITLTNENIVFITFIVVIIIMFIVINSNNYKEDLESEG